MPNQAILFLQNGKSQNVGYPFFPLTPSIVLLSQQIQGYGVIDLERLLYNQASVQHNVTQQH